MGNRKRNSSSRRSSTKNQKKTRIDKDDEVEDVESQDSQESQDEENAVNDEQTAKGKPKAMEVEDEGNAEDDVSVKRDWVVERRGRRSSRRSSTKVKKGKEDEGKDLTDVDSQESQEETNKDDKVEIEEEDNVKDNTMAVDEGKVEDNGKTELEVTTDHLEENIQDGKPDLYVSKELPQDAKDRAGTEMEGNQPCVNEEVVSQLDISTPKDDKVENEVPEGEDKDHVKSVNDVKIENDGKTEVEVKTGNMDDGTGSENIQDGRPDVSKKLPQMEVEDNQPCADKEELVSELNISTNANALVGTQGEKEAEDQLNIKEYAMVEKNGMDELEVRTVVIDDCTESESIEDGKREVCTSKELLQDAQDKTNMEIEDAQPHGDKEVVSVSGLDIDTHYANQSADISTMDVSCCNSASGLAERKETKLDETVKEETLEKEIESAKKEEKEGSINAVVDNIEDKGLDKNVVTEKVKQNDTSMNMVDLSDLDATDSQLCILEEAAETKTNKTLNVKEKFGLRSGSEIIKDLMQDLADMNRLITRARNDLNATKARLSSKWKMTF